MVINDSDGEFVSDWRRLTEHFIDVHYFTASQRSGRSGVGMRGWAALIL